MILKMFSIENTGLKERLNTIFYTAKKSTTGVLLTVTASIPLGAALYFAHGSFDLVDFVHEFIG